MNVVDEPFRQDECDKDEKGKGYKEPDFSPVEVLDHIFLLSAKAKRP
jgi:hypothetical protein